MEFKFAEDGERALVEEQASKILFLEWRSSSEEREYRQKLSDMAWRIASLEKEIDTINKDSSRLKINIFQLETSLRAAEDELKGSQRLCQSYEHYKSDFQNGQNEIRELHAEIFNLRAERTKHIQIRASEQHQSQRIKHDLRLIFRECGAVNDAMSHIFSFQQGFRQETVTVLDQLGKSIGACIEEMIEAKKDFLGLVSNGNDYRLHNGLNDCHSRVLAKNKSDARPVSLMCSSALFRSQALAVKEEITAIIHDSVTALAEMDTYFQHYSQQLSNMFGTVKAIGNECEGCCALAIELRESLDSLGSDHRRELAAYRQAASRLRSFIGVDPIHKHLSILPTNLEQIRQMIRHACETHSYDDCMSELSTVSAVHDTSLKSVFSARPTLPNTRFLKGLQFPRSGMGVAACGERIIFAGGTDGQSIWRDMEYFDLSTCMWGSVSMPSPRICFQLVSARAKLYLLGGEDGEGRVLASCMEYDARTGKWSQLAPMRSARTGFGAQPIESDGLILVAGGTSAVILCHRTASSSLLLTLVSLTRRMERRDHGGKRRDIRH